ncbi:MAG: hypothetical protein IJQ28_05395 [Clostridia bacterium]|nr:hypothetical protein [Clostridia bacterium]
MENVFIEWAPIIIVVLVFLLKNQIFVTPTQLLKVKEEIITQIKNEYASKELAEEIKKDIQEIKDQLQNLTNHLISRNE